MGTLASIEAALFARAEALILTPALEISWPNVKFSPPEGAYLRVDLLPNNTQRFLIGSSDPHRWLGLLQITVVTPENIGPVVASGVADAILAHFPADLRLIDGSVLVRITKTPDVAPPFRDGTTWRLPVSISYESFN